MSVRLFGERWNPHLIFDELGRSSLLWEDSMFYAAEKCGGLTAAEKNDLVSAWEAAFAEPFSSPRDGIAVFSSPGHVYVLESVEELDGNPLLREAITTTLRLALTQYSGRRLQRFLEEHPLGVLLE